MSISARTLLGNLASQRVMQKCGLERAGSFTYPDDLKPSTGDEQRAAVKYLARGEEWLRRWG